MMPSFEWLSWTNLLIGVNVATYVVQLTALGMCLPAAGVNQELDYPVPPFSSTSDWRLASLLTNHFVHFYYLHLAINMLVMFFLNEVESAFTRPLVFLVAVLTAGFTGSCLLVLFCDEMQNCGVVYGGASMLVCAGLGMLGPIAWLRFLADPARKGALAWIVLVTLFLAVAIAALASQSAGEALPHGLGMFQGLLLGLALLPWLHVEVDLPLQLRLVCYFW
jgi:membrane associated rhomboid family serine protease